MDHFESFVSSMTTGGPENVVSVNSCESPMLMDVVLDRGAKKRTSTSMEDSSASQQKSLRAVRDNVASSSKNGHSSQVKNAASSESFNNRYGSLNSAPFVVYMRVGEDYITEPAYEVIMKKHMSRIINKDINNMRKIGKGKIAIEMRTATSANSLVSHPKLAKLGYTAYIPSHKVFRYGIIKDVSTSVSDAELKTNLRFTSKIIEFKRLNGRTVKDGVVEYTPSTTINLKFSGIGHISKFCIAPDAGCMERIRTVKTKFVNAKIYPRCALTVLGIIPPLHLPVHILSGKKKFKHSQPPITFQ